MEFCQIQLNYLDWNFQNAKAKVELMNERNIPIWVMEGLRGGMLASLSEENTAKLKEMRPDESVVGWAFRFLQSVPGVTVSLSGMSNLDQLKDNIRIFSEDKALSESEMKFITKMADEMVRKGVLPCTACRYCTSHCPKHLDIPHLLELYNEHSFTGGGFIAPMAVDALDPDRRPMPASDAAAARRYVLSRSRYPKRWRTFRKCSDSPDNSEYVPPCRK